MVILWGWVFLMSEAPLYMLYLKVARVLQEENESLLKL